MSSETDVHTEHAAPAPPVPTGNPLLLGLATFLPGAITLGLWLVDFLPLTLPGGMIAAVTFSNGLFLLIATVWAARIGASTVAGVLGTFAALWLSFGFLLLGVLNGWLGVTSVEGLQGAALEEATAQAAEDVQDIQAAYVLAFLIVIVLLTLGTLRLPAAFTVGLLLVDAALALILAYVQTATATYATWGGVCVFAFCAVFAYIWVDAVGQDLGGKPMPMGPAIIR